MLQSYFGGGSSPVFEERQFTMPQTIQRRIARESLYFGPRSSVLQLVYRRHRSSSGDGKSSPSPTGEATSCDSTVATTRLSHKAKGKEPVCGGRESGNDGAALFLFQILRVNRGSRVRGSGDFRTHEYQIQCGISPS